MYFVKYGEQYLHDPRTETKNGITWNNGNYVLRM